MRTNIFNFAIILDPRLIFFPFQIHAKVTRRTVRSPISFAFRHFLTSSKSSSNAQINPFRSFNNCEVVRSQKEGRRMIQKINVPKKLIRSQKSTFKKKTWRTNGRMKPNNHHRHRPLKPPLHSLPPPSCTFQPI